MKQTIKERLKRHPALFEFARRIYMIFHPSLQTRILRRVKHKDPIFFVQVGSNDGLQGDPLHGLITANEKWRGIFVEPVGYLYERLKHTYGHSDRFIYENIAIGPERGRFEFHYVSEKAKSELGDALPYWYDQMGSFDRNNMLDTLDGMLEPYILSEKIDTVPLQDLFSKHKVTGIDILHIDAEGYDYKVISTLDFSRYQPLVVLYEHVNITSDEKRSAKSLLRQNGYRTFDFAHDTLAIRTR